jgi:hypothetical protein
VARVCAAPGLAARDLAGRVCAAVELYLTFGQRPPGARAPAFPPVTGSSGWRATLDVDEAGAGCLEVGWRPVMPV